MATDSAFLTAKPSEHTERISSQPVEFLTSHLPDIRIYLVLVDVAWVAKMLGIVLPAYVLTIFLS
jgi:hypothetical protein